jgi:hypothetical protein
MDCGMKLFMLLRLFLLLPEADIRPSIECLRGVRREGEGS